MRCCGGEISGLRGSAFCVISHVGRRVIADNNDTFKIGQVTQYRLNIRQQRRADKQRLGARVREHETIGVDSQAPY